MVVGDTLMATEKEKFLACLPYQPWDTELTADRTRAKNLCYQLNQTPFDQQDERQRIARELVNAKGEVWLEAPFHCDYGYRITVGERFYANHGCVILDSGGVVAGKDCMLGPNVVLTSVTHTLDRTERATGVEYGKPIVLGDDVWVGANATILPGVTIGDGAVIGAGAVVTKDIPANSVVAGVPARIIKRL